MRKLENDSYIPMKSNGSYDITGDEVKDQYAVYYCDFCKHKIGSMLESKDVDLSKKDPNRYRPHFGEVRFVICNGEKTLMKKLHFCSDECRRNGINLEMSKLVNIGYKEDEIENGY